MNAEAVEDDTGGGEYFVMPEEAVQFLPPEWRDALRTIVADGRAVLEAVDSDIKKVIRLVGAFPAMTSLRYSQHRLSTAVFEPTTDTILEHEMLTTAFVIAYVRLMDGGQGSGVSRNALPTHLRRAHDEIVELRNKRFAHNVGHESVEGMLEIGFENGRFDLNVSFRMGYYVRGADEWGELVAFLDQLMFERLGKLLEKLTQKTGHEWKFPSGPPPPWAGT
ncbi:hypothetical protein NKI01_09030 [Mesorhizobium sp. M0815]|uniref:hypothetical protein n=1 Tax=Mesorhizobium sp. M0815 TaxID=2957005 RepID=UPI0033396C18